MDYIAKPRNRIVALSLILLFASLLQAKQKTYGNMRVSKVVRVTDGDTFLANLASSYPDLIADSVSVRVYGIDTPELRGPDSLKARAARDSISAFLGRAKRVTLVDVRRDKYFRILATVKCDSLDVGAALVRSGLAKPYFGGTKE